MVIAPGNRSSYKALWMNRFGSGCPLPSREVLGRAIRALLLGKPVKSKLALLPPRRAKVPKAERVAAYRRPTWRSSAITPSIRARGVATGRGSGWRRRAGL